jgi:hypothetical protein
MTVLSSPTNAKHRVSSFTWKFYIGNTMCSPIIIPLSTVNNRAPDGRFLIFFFFWSYCVYRVVNACHDEIPPRRMQLQVEYEIVRCWTTTKKMHRIFCQRNLMSTQNAMDKFWQNYKKKISNFPTSLTEVHIL